MKTKEQESTREVKAATGHKKLPESTTADRNNTSSTNADTNSQDDLISVDSKTKDNTNLTLVTATKETENGFKATDCHSEKTLRVAEENGTKKAERNGENPELVSSRYH